MRPNQGLAFDADHYERDHLSFTRTGIPNLRESKRKARPSVRHFALLMPYPLTAVLAQPLDRTDFRKAHDHPAQGEACNQLRCKRSSAPYQSGKCMRERQASLQHRPPTRDAQVKDRRETGAQNEIGATGASQATLPSRSPFWTCLTRSNDSRRSDPPRRESDRN